MTARTWNRMERLQLACTRDETVETLSGRIGRVHAVDFEGNVWFMDDREGSVTKLRPFSFAKVGS